MSNYKYVLEPYSGSKSRFKCPNCNKSGSFTKYIDRETGEYLNEGSGMCNRIIKCGYHSPPKNNLFQNEDSIKLKTIKSKMEVKQKPSFHDEKLVKKSFETENSNHFIQFLTKLWDEDVANYLQEKYNIGTSSHWQGSTIFWQVDINQQIRAGKIMLYDPTNGKRVKVPYNHITWAHKALKLEHYKLRQCLFGEHLLKKHPTLPVAIVESEKTAILASVLLPDFLWLSCGSVNNLSKERTKCLRFRKVVLFPDVGCYDLWSEKSKKLSTLMDVTVSDLLEKKASKNEFELGCDLSDYLLPIVKETYEKETSPETDLV